jgi:hypothetical protein
MGEVERRGGGRDVMMPHRLPSLLSRRERDATPVDFDLLPDDAATHAVITTA